MSLLTRDYDYPLPENLIARRPLARRDESRMMVLHRQSERIEHGTFRDFPGFLNAGDLVVLNDTKVIPARVFANDGKIELLVLERLSDRVWKCMVRPGRKLRAGATLTLHDARGTVREVLANGERVIEFDRAVDISKLGVMPLPPYLERAAEPSDTERYQTVYAQTSGAVAAPTAGLHFTPEILSAIPHAFLTLHVGAGTFKPVQTERITDHAMHEEQFTISSETARAVNDAKRLIAIGTTTTRVLESCTNPDGTLAAQRGATSIFIHPPYQFRAVNVLLTNFHLPKSTLLMLVSAFAGRDFILRAYHEAMRCRYRFYSYGDCMLII